MRPSFVCATGAALVLLTLGPACSSSPDAALPGAVPEAADATEATFADGGASPGPDADAGADAAHDAALPPGASAGCGAPIAPYAPGLGAGLTLAVAGARRTFALSIPPGYAAGRAYPLVFTFHSGGGNGVRARNYFAFESFAGEEAVFVYPDGERGQWDLETTAARNKDVAFFDALLAELGAKLCIDTARVFATGSSMGAFLTNQLGCRRGDVLRAIAPHAGGGPWETGGKYDSAGRLVCGQRAPAAMVFVGLADKTVKPAEGEKSLAHWSWAAGCTAETSPVAPSPCVAYQGCRAPVISCKLPGVGHRIWDQGPKATWDFFAGF